MQSVIESHVWPIASSANTELRQPHKGRLMGLERELSAAASDCLGPALQNKNGTVRTQPSNRETHRPIERHQTHLQVADAEPHPCLASCHARKAAPVESGLHHHALPVEYEDSDVAVGKRARPRLPVAAGGELRE